MNTKVENRTSVDQLMQDFEPLVVKTAKRFMKVYPFLLLDDLVQASRIGLWKAIRGYNQENGAQLSTYARRCMWNEMLRELNSQSVGAIPSQNSAVINIEEMGSDDEDIFGKGRFLVNEFIKKLPPVQRRVARSLYQKGLTQAETSRKFGVSKEAIRKTVEKIHIKGKQEFLPLAA